MNNRISIATIDSPEFINLHPMDINPLMSKCDVKVLYVGQNRNRSCITKEVATEMSKTLRGCPIVGYYIENKEDFGDHGDQVIIDGEGIKFNKLTKPYGFIAPDAKVWFQFFEDTDEFGNTTIREYLMAEGYLWTGQFEECQKVLENNNPQSMELDEKTLKGYWSTDNNKGIDFFIINDAVFSKLCILGEDVEPCFEGASINAPEMSSQFSKNDDFAKSLFTMMSELRYALNNKEGGKSMPEQVLDNEVESTSFEKEATVESPETTFEEAPAGDASADASETEASALTGESANESEETNDNSVILNETDEKILAELGDDYAPEGETNKEALIKDGATNVPKSITQNAKCNNEEDKKDEKKKDENSEDKEDKSETDKSEDNTEDKKKKFSLEEEFENLKVEYAALKEENAKLLAFKQEVEDKEKDDLIASFYMLSDEDKKSVVENKANYSLKEIKAELSMICVDKKVNFSHENADIIDSATTVNLNSYQAASDLPEWLKAVEETRKRNN